MAALRVLVAEDDESVRDSLERLFTVAGYAVDTANNYCDVLELLRAHVYALILSDNGMPLSPGSTRVDHTCGLQLLAYAKLHGHNMNTPFVLHTGDDREETKRLASEFGGIYRAKLDTSSSLLDFCAALLPK